MNELAIIDQAIRELRATLKAMVTRRNEILDQQAKPNQDDTEPVVVVGPDGKKWTF